MGYAKRQKLGAGRMNSTATFGQVMANDSFRMADHTPGIAGHLQRDTAQSNFVNHQYACLVRLRKCGPIESGFEPQYSKSSACTAQGQPSSEASMRDA